MFEIKVTGIFKLSNRGQIICGITNEFHYRGTIQCEGKIFRVIGSPVFEYDLNNASYLLDTFELEDSYIGKTFTEYKRTEENF